MLFKDPTSDQGFGKWERKRIRLVKLATPPAAGPLSCLVTDRGPGQILAEQDLADYLKDNLID